MPGLYDKVIIVGSDGEPADVTAGALSTSGGGGGGGGGAVTVADGADVTQGAIADAVVAAGAAGTASAKLRRLTTDLAALLARLPAALGAGGGLKVDGSGTALPVSGTVTITPSGTQAVSVADAADVNAGSIADAVVAAGAAGTISAKIRRLTTQLAGGLPAALGGGGGLKVDGSGTPLPVSGTVTITPSGTQAVTIADGADVAEGAIADAVVAAGASGSISAKLRRVTAQLAGGLPAALGGTTSAASLPVVVASDQVAIATKVADGADVNAGAIADAAVAGGAAGTISGKLRQISSDIKDSAGYLLTIAGRLPTSLGSKTSANSLAVVIASDQAPPAFTYGSGEKAGSATASQFATITTKWAKVKAEYDNAGRVYIGISTVTKADGSTDTTTGLQLVAGDETPWFPISNLNQLYLICDNAGDDVTYCYLV